MCAPTQGYVLLHNKSVLLSSVMPASTQRKNVNPYSEQSAISYAAYACVTSYRHTNDTATSRHTDDKARHVKAH